MKPIPPILTALFFTLFIVNTGLAKEAAKNAVPLIDPLRFEKDIGLIAFREKVFPPVAGVLKVREIT